MSIKSLLLSLWTGALLAGCTGSPENQATDHSKSDQNMMEQNDIATAGNHILMVRIKTDLPEEELLKRAHQRAPEFAAIPGLVQKYYTKIGEGEYGGIYVWDSEASIQAFRASTLAATIAKAYEATAPPTVEKVDILFQLRD